MTNFSRWLKGILFCIGTLLHFSALAQIDNLNESSIENYIKTQFKYKAFELIPLSQTSGDSTLKELYWLNGDFDNDGAMDLIALAFVQKQKGSKHREILVYLKKRNSFTQISLDNDFTYEFFERVQTSAKTLLRSGKSYIIITTTTPTRHLTTYGTLVSHDTLSIVSNKPMPYTAHPSAKKIKQVKFSTSGCYGTCPIFELTINSNRSVEFNGIEYVDKKGYHNLVINQSDFNYLIELLSNIGLPTLKSKYAVGWTDDQTSHLEIKYENGDTKTIDDYGMKGTYGLATLYKFLLELRHF